MKTPQKWAVNLFKEEFSKSENLGRLLLVAAVFNIPVDGFIPYISQAITIIVLSIFLKKYYYSSISHSRIVSAICIGIMAIQVVWVPYITQLTTLVLIGILYGVFTKYK